MYNVLLPFGSYALEPLALIEHGAPLTIPYHPHSATNDFKYSLQALNEFSQYLVSCYYPTNILYILFLQFIFSYNLLISFTSFYLNQKIQDS